VILDRARAGTPWNWPPHGAGGERRPHPPVRVDENFGYALSVRPETMPPAEAYDKVATSCSASPIPEAPSSTAWAAQRQSAGVRFTFAKMKGNTLDFSFSGLKTAVLRWVETRDLTAD